MMLDPDDAVLSGRGRQRGAAVMPEPGFDRGGDIVDHYPVWKRLMWMAWLWVASVAVLGAIAFAIGSWLMG